MTILVCTAFLLMLVRTITDPDLWWQLRFGLDTIKNGQVASSDSYSYVTSGNEWNNHEWLTEVAFALAWTAGGVGGLILLKVLVGGATLGLLYYHLLSLRVDHVRAAILLLFFSLGLLPYLGIIRPQIFTYLLFALFLMFIWRAENGDYRWLWGLPVVTAAWANLHGGWLAGLAVLAVWAAFHLVLNSKAWPKVIPPVLLAGLAASANPYGFRLVTFLLSIATLPRPGLGEWQPITLLSPPGVLWTIMVLVATIGIAYSLQPRRIPLLAVLGITALSPWFAIRNFPLFATAALILASEHIASAWERISPMGQQRKTVHPLASAIGLLLAGALLVLAYAEGLQHIKIGLTVPAAPVALLKKSGVAGNLAINFNWGGYAIWHLGPRIKVSIDGRSETVYSEKNVYQTSQFMLGIGEWDALLEQYPTDMALVKSDSAVYNLLQLEPDWVLVYSDEFSALFARKGSAVLKTLQHTATEFSPPPQTGYFP
jgi:hypothetical protein